MATPGKRRNSSQTPEERDDPSVDLLLRVASGPDFLPYFEREEALRLQAEFEPLVQMAIDAPEELQRQEFSPRLAELTQGGLSIWLGSARLKSSGKQTLVRHSIFRDTHARLSYALLLLAEEQAPYQRALCRCKLPRCRKFYLAKRNPKGGPANRTYCDSAHRDEHHNSFDRKVAAAAGKARHK
ncbi:MAG TPA: hypothetical protein VMU40_07720 [Steroidobacteraceae bacterium]|nr:hypothetical protein [Steroidobacteraceae bacterium]